MPALPLRWDGSDGDPDVYHRLELSFDENTFVFHIGWNYSHNGEHTARRYLGKFRVDADTLVLQVQTQEDEVHKECLNEGCEAAEYSMSSFRSRHSYCKRRDCFAKFSPAGWRSRPYTKSVAVELTEEVGGRWRLSHPWLGQLVAEPPG